MELSLLPCPFCGKPAEASHTMRATIEETMEAEPYINCSQPMCAGRHVCASVSEWQYRTDRISELEADIVTRRLDYTEDCKRLDARIEELEAQLAAHVQAIGLLSTVLPWRKVDILDPMSLVHEVMDDVAAAQERNTALQSEHLDHVNALNEQLAAAQERERTLNNKLYYACELAIAYAHSAKDQEWAAEIIEALTPPEQEE